jgi:hypothetical protein
MINTLQENVAIILPENGLEEKLAQAKKKTEHYPSNWVLILPLLIFIWDMPWCSKS